MTRLVRGSRKRSAVGRQSGAGASASPWPRPQRGRAATGPGRSRAAAAGRRAAPPASSRVCGLEHNAPRGARARRSSSRPAAAWLASRSNSCSRSASLSRTPPARTRFDLDRGAVGHDLGELLADLRGVEAHGDDRVGPHQPGVVDHPVDRMAPRVLQQLGVLGDLAAPQRLERRAHAAGEAHAADDQAVADAEALPSRVGPGISSAGGHRQTGDRRGRRSSRGHATNASRAPVQLPFALDADPMTLCLLPRRWPPLALAACGGSSSLELSSARARRARRVERRRTRSRPPRPPRARRDDRLRGRAARDGPAAGPGQHHRTGTVDGIHCAPDRAARLPHPRPPGRVQERARVPLPAGVGIPGSQRPADHRRGRSPPAAVHLLAAHPHLRRRHPHRVAHQADLHAGQLLRRVASAAEPDSGRQRCTARSPRSSTASRGRRTRATSRCMPHAEIQLNIGEPAPPLADQSTGRQTQL